MSDIQSLTTRLAQLMIDMIKNEKEMRQMAPGMAAFLEPLFNVPPEEVERAITEMVKKMETDGVPEDQREKLLTEFCEHLESAREGQEFTRWRIDSRVQKEGEERVKPEFNSFCKRKGEW